MKARLKNRQMQIPNGMRFYLPQVKWQAPRGASLSQIAQALQRVVLANPALAQKHEWPKDLPAIEDWVDEFNAALCARSGWDSYITTDPVAYPKLSPQHLRESLQSVANVAERVKALVSGAKTLMEWDDSGEPPVDPKQALERARICAACKYNRPGDFTSWFTVPASELIKRRIEKAQARNLRTDLDDQLNLCELCFCPLKLKVHVPLPWIKKRLDPKTLNNLREVPGCWITREL